MEGLTDDGCVGWRWKRKERCELCYEVSERERNQRIC